MAIDLTTRSRRALEEVNIKPNLIVRIEGYSTLFGARKIKEILKYGEPDVFYGDPGLFYGGLVDASDQKTYVDSQETSYSIKQQISYDDEAGGSSISSMTVGLVDKNQEITKLISPGQEIDDILGRKVEVFQTFGDVDFFEDSILVFKGFVTKVESRPGTIRLKLNHPDNKKNVRLFQTVETQLSGNINSSITTLTLVDGSNFSLPQGPLTSYVRIGDEIMQYSGRSGNVLTGLTRGALGTTAAAHNDGAQARSIYSLEDNPLDLALKLMMSGFGTDPIHENINAFSFVKVGAGTTQINNAIYFNEINIPQDYGLRIGDTVTLTGATNPANNITARTVTDIQLFESGYYIVVDGAPLVLEVETSAVMSTFSQYNVLPDGMRMKPEEVDIDEHLRIRDFFFSGTQMRFFLKEDEIEGKAFLDTQIYKPLACYSLPRKTQASVGYTVGPIPGSELVTLDSSAIKSPKDIMITRTTNRSFFNEVVYKYDDDPTSDGVKYLSGRIEISQTSKNRIPGTTKTYVVESNGLRTDLNAVTIAQTNSTRILDRYKFGAELISCKTMLRDSAGIEIGDVIVGEFEELQVTDISQGNRQFKARLLEVQNKTISLKTGNVDLVLLDTGLNLENTRYGLMSPASIIAGVISSSQFVIGPDPFYKAQFGNDEYRKWQGLITQNQKASIRIHNADYSIDEDLVAIKIDENTFTLEDPATITLEAGLIVEFTGYADTDTSDKQKLIYAYMTDDPAFGDGGIPYTMI